MQQQGRSSGGSLSGRPAGGGAAGQPPMPPGGGRAAPPPLPTAPAAIDLHNIKRVLLPKDQLPGAAAIERRLQGGPWVGLQGVGSSLRPSTCRRSRRRSLLPRAARQAPASSPPHPMHPQAWASACWAGWWCA